MKRWKECEDGFTMVEMIITIAISAILVGTVITAFGYLNSGNAKRSAARFNSKLTTAQTETMMLKDVGGSGVNVRAKIEGGGTYTLGQNNMIKVAFDKASGAYKTANYGVDTDNVFYNEIEFSGREKYKVTLVKMTGKHVMSQ